MPGHPGGDLKHKSDTLELFSAWSFGNDGSQPQKRRCTTFSCWNLVNYILNWIMTIESIELCSHFKIAQVKPSNLLPIHWSSSILWNSTRGNVKRTICKFWQQAICKIVVDHPRHFPQKNWPVEHAQKGRTRCLWQWDDKCTFVFPEVFHKKCALCLFSGHLQPWFWLHLCSWSGGYAGGWLEANRETCGLCQSLVVCRSSLGDSSMDFTFFITDCSLKQKGEAAMNDVKWLVPAPNAALAKAANVTLSDSTGYVCQWRSRLPWTCACRWGRQGRQFNLRVYLGKRFESRDQVWKTPNSSALKMWRFNRVLERGRQAESAWRWVVWFRVVWSSLVKDYQTNECNLQVV